MSWFGLDWWCHSTVLWVEVDWRQRGTLIGTGLGGGEGRLTEVGGGASIGRIYFLRIFLSLLVTVMEPSILTV